MSDTRFIKLTESEFELIMQLLIEADTRQDQDGQPAYELHDDLQEQWFRNSDQWGWPEEDGLTGQTYSIAEDDFIDAGIRAREQVKSHRHGEFEVQTTASELHRPFADSDPRTARLMQGTVTAFISNDPIDW